MGGWGGGGGGGGGGWKGSATAINEIIQMNLAIHLDYPH